MTMVFSEKSLFLGGIIYDTATASNTTTVLAKKYCGFHIIYLQYCHRVVFDDSPATTVIVLMSLNIFFLVVFPLNGVLMLPTIRVLLVLGNDLTSL